MSAPPGRVVHDASVLGLVRLLRETEVDGLADTEGHWFREAVRLDGENRELRGLMTSLLLAVAEREELGEFGRRLIGRRFPREATP